MRKGRIGDLFGDVRENRSESDPILFKEGWSIVFAVYGMLEGHGSALIGRKLDKDILRPGERRFSLILFGQTSQTGTQYILSLFEVLKKTCSGPAPSCGEYHAFTRKLIRRRNNELSTEQ